MSFADKGRGETIKHYSKIHNQVKEQRFYCCSTFYSHYGIINNEQNLYTNLSVKRP